MENVRIEVDLPVVIVNQYGDLELPNHKSLKDVLGTYFGKGTVITVHIIAESTGDTRGFCDFIDPESSFKHKCGFALGSDGTCWAEEDHERKRAKQLALIVEEVS